MKKIMSIVSGLIFVLNFIYAGFLYCQVSQWEKQLAKDPGNKEILLNLGRHYHNLGGTKGNKGAVKKAEKYLSKLLEIEPRNGVALVYYGSVLTMKARNTSFDWDKMKYIRKGFSLMDKAIDLYPDNPEIRLIRGINNSNVPERFHRLAIALEDFKYIKKLNKVKPLNMTDKFWLPYYYYYGLALSKNNESNASKEKFMKTIETDPGSGYALKAKQKLKTLEE